MKITAAAHASEVDQRTSIVRFPHLRAQETQPRRTAKKRISPTIPSNAIASSAYHTRFGRESQNSPLSGQSLDCRYHHTSGAISACEMVTERLFNSCVLAGSCLEQRINATSGGEHLLRVVRNARNQQHAMFQHGAVTRPQILKIFGAALQTRPALGFCGARLVDIGTIRVVVIAAK
jgi:hypothetical protein